uniref:Putative dna-binding bright/brcaa1/rbp1 n=3 Tax=Ixodes TaxID=6944 RepID=A0A4D5S144_IXOSC
MSLPLPLAVSQGPLFSLATPPPHMMHLPPTLTPHSTVSTQDLSKYASFEEQYGKHGKSTEFSRDFKVSPSSKSSRSSRGDTNGRVSMDDISKLYELSDDPKRKEFLDDLFTFMQKRGTPVNRIPIMAKQVLDLYELYRLVVSRGGLVEVINKKIWREITKGLNLPSSITSAAFTLRTQYMKYLYPYECEKEKLSQPDELQAAIDGNRREGRRSSYSHYAEMMSTARSQHSSPISLVCRQANGHSSTPHQGAPSSGEEDNSLSLSLYVPQQQEALNLEVPRGDHKPLDPRRLLDEPLLNGPPSKRFLSSEEERILSHTAQMPTTHIKLTSRGDGRSQVDSSMVVTMEINGIMYQGVLFAQAHRSRLS